MREILYIILAIHYLIGFGIVYADTKLTKKFDWANIPLFIISPLAIWIYLGMAMRDKFN